MTAADVKPKEYQLFNPATLQEIVWTNVIVFAALHVGAVVGLYQLIFLAKWQTVIFTYLYYVMSGLGITAGCHRLWAHRSYKANLPLRWILMIFQSMALQNDVIEWSRDHRTHHKWSDTEADPHNSNRGLFFSHIGWLLCRKHPKVISKGQTLDMSDLLADPVLQFQQKWYKSLGPLLCFVAPAVIPAVFWGESLVVGFYTAGLLRYIVTLHCTWMVNSVAHKYGNRPYDKCIEPRQNIATAFVALGEGWHNYHHSFPYDYKAAELPYTVNFTTMFIDAMAAIGWVTDRKFVSEEMIRQRIARTGE